MRDVMKELKESKEYLEAHYPKSVRERIALIQKVQKDLDLKNKKAEKVKQSELLSITPNIGYQLKTSPESRHYCFTASNYRNIKPIKNGIRLRSHH